MKLSVLIPIYNEEKTVKDILNLILALKIPKEIVIVDDYSQDKTRHILETSFSDNPDIKIIYHHKNMGKGEAVKTALKAASGDFCIIQDADLEYSPSDYQKLIEPLLAGKSDAVFGSRFLLTRKSTAFWHYLINRFLTELTNILFKTKLTDMATCYKMMRTDVLKKLDIQANRFEIDAEIIAKLLKYRYKIIEVPISYKGRFYHEGKKIGWKDGISIISHLLRLRFKKIK